MKKIQIALGLFLMLAVTTPAVSDEIRVEYPFERPDVSAVVQDGIRYHHVTLPGAPNGGAVGQPALPVRGARILLPPGTRVKSVDVEVEDRVMLGRDFLVEPVSLPVRLSAAPGEHHRPVPDAAVYGSDAAFPAHQVAVVGTQEFRGHSLLVLKLMPVQYIPASGALSSVGKLTVVVRTLDDGHRSPNYRGLTADRKDLRAQVDNPRAIGAYAPAGQRTAASFDLLILTTPSLAASFEPLKTYHDANGITTEIRTTTDAGGADPESVRDYIRLHYQQSGISSVLIGGDDDVIPARDLWVDSLAGYTEPNMPSDIYFGCLDGTYNNDGDNRWGEPTDGEGGGDVDLVAEVYVGRAAVGTAAEATRFVDKTLWYLQRHHPDTAHVLLVGEHLGFGGVSEYAAATLEELVDGTSEHGYTTTGIPAAEYTIDKLFERDGNWSRNTLASRINDQDVHILNHLGHGMEDYAMKFYNSDVLSQLNNDDLCFVYSQTCLAGHFDGRDCWAETMNVKTDSGAFAVIMNARYGWGAGSSTDGPSQRFNREFWDAIFGEGLGTLGRANQDSKEDNIHRIGDACMRWCTYEINLFGDPTLSLTGQAPPPPPPVGAVLVAGPGPAAGNSCEVRVFEAEDISPGPTATFPAYGVDKYGVNVALGDIDGDGTLEIVTGPGPGAVFGPHVRAFELDGMPVAGVSFLAYGTLKYGVNVACGDMDGDGTDEIITGAGPGAVFGPHVRGFSFDGITVSPLPGISFFAYGTLKYGVNVACGDIDGDGMDEIITGAGPGAVFGPHVRGFDVDGSAAVPMPGISTFAYGTLRWGVNVSCGNIDGTGGDEIITGVGPGAALGAHVRAFGVQAGQLSPIAAVNFFPYTDFTYGAQVGCGDGDGDGICEIYTGPGPDPDAGTRVRGWNFDGGQLAAIAECDFQAFGGDTSHGVQIAVAAD